MLAVADRNASSVLTRRSKNKTYAGDGASPPLPALRGDPSKKNGTGTCKMLEGA